MKRIALSLIRIVITMAYCFGLGTLISLTDVEWSTGVLLGVIIVAVAAMIKLHKAVDEMPYYKNMLVIFRPGMSKNGSAVGNVNLGATSEVAKAAREESGKVVSSPISQPRFGLFKSLFVEMNGFEMMLGIALSVFVLYQMY